MRKIIILKVPENVDFDNPDKNQVEFITATSARWSESIIPGTRVVGGYRLIRLRVTATIENVQQLLIDKLPDWTVLGLRSAIKQVERGQQGKPIMLERVDKITKEVIRSRSMKLVFDLPINRGIAAFLIGQKTRPLQLARGQNDDEIWLK